MRYLVGGGGDLLRRAPAEAVAALRHPQRAVREFTATAASIARFVRPVMTTKSPVMRERRLRWHFDTLDVPVDGLKAAAATVDGTLNDAYVAAIAGGFRRYHDRHGAIVEDLRISMPISVRHEDDAIGGNKITIVRFTVPVRLRTPAERTARIGELCRSARREPALGYGNWIAGVLNLLPVAVSGGMLKHVDLLASNVPGFPIRGVRRRCPHHGLLPLRPHLRVVGQHHPRVLRRNVQHRHQHRRGCGARPGRVEGVPARRVRRGAGARRRLIRGEHLRDPRALHVEAPRGKVEPPQFVEVPGHRCHLVPVGLRTPSVGKPLGFDEVAGQVALRSPIVVARIGEDAVFVVQLVQPKRWLDRSGAVSPQRRWRCRTGSRRGTDGRCARRRPRRR